jgi:aspartate carbamoyltransferase catalytic subunit
MPTNLLDFESISKQSILEILDRASYFKHKIETNESLEQPFKSKIMANLFYEPSTRTQYSFDIAAHKLGIKTINPNMSQLSHMKGESFLDTINTFMHMGVNLITIRHSENFMPHFIASEINLPIINAGDGTNHHPSQAFIDLFTILQYKENVKDIIVSIVGDIAHSRVARSVISILTIMGAVNIRLISPIKLKPQEEIINTVYYEDLHKGIENSDVVITLRIQTERLEENLKLEKNTNYQQYMINDEALKHIKKDAIIMHPGPINRGIEIDSITAGSPQSKIKQQVANGVPIRMAIIEHLLNDKK